VLNQLINEPFSKTETLNIWLKAFTRG